MKCLEDWFYIIINIQTLWTNLLIYFLNNLHSSSSQRCLRWFYNLLTTN
jgi:hypothetical protein